jgi:hypothetical protein
MILANLVRFCDDGKDASRQTGWFGYGYTCGTVSPSPQFGAREESDALLSAFDEDMKYPSFPDIAFVLCS